MKKLLLLKSVLLLCALIVGSGSVWAADETITFSEQGYGNQQAISTVSGDDFTITFNKGTNSNAPKYYTTGSAIRVYGGGYMTVTSSKTIVKIELSFGSDDGSNAITTDVVTYSNGTWTGSAKSVKFTVGGTSGHRRIASVAVTYKVDVTHTFSYSATNGTVTVTDAKSATVSSGASVAEGATLNVTATPNAGYVFSSWSVEGTGSAVPNTASASTTFTMGTADATLTAVFAEDNTEYTVTCNDAANGSVSASPASATSGTTVTLTTTPASNYETGTVTVTDASSNDITVTQTATNTYTFTMPSSNVTVDATFNQLYTVTCNDASNGSVSADVASAIAGATVTLTTTPATGYSVASVSVVDADENTVTVTNTATNTYTFTMPSSNVTVSAMFANYIIDVLTRTTTGITATSYSAWSGKTSNSSAVYAGNSAGGNSSIQLKSNDNISGVITTTSGGKVRKITVSWNSNTANGRTIDIYGKNTAYSSATNLYSSTASTQGTKLGSIVRSKSVGDTESGELEITGDYAYIGLRSNSGAMYLNEIDITWEPVSISISDAGWASFSCASEVAIPDGVTAYYAQQKDESTITLKEITGGYIPANTGVVVSGTANSYAATITATDATLEEDNLLQPWLTAGTPEATTYYTLAVDGDKNPVFKESTGGTLTAGKAYLVLPSGVNVRELSVVFDSETTGITSTAMQSSTGQYYDLQGRRIAQPAKGLYIVNGRKVVIR